MPGISLIAGQNRRIPPVLTRNDETARKSRVVCAGLSWLESRDPGSSPRLTRNDGGEQPQASRRPHQTPAFHSLYVRRLREFDRVALNVPSIEVDTTSGYRPGIAAIVSFVSGS